jgi:hypothetical protein
MPFWFHRTMVCIAVRLVQAQGCRSRLFRPYVNQSPYLSNASLCRPFHQLEAPRMQTFLTANRGWGVRAAEVIPKGTFIVEYAGN